jgi:hypothetical protein
VIGSVGVFNSFDGAALRRRRAAALGYWSPVQILSPRHFSKGSHSASTPNGSFKGWELRLDDHFQLAELEVPVFKEN